MRSVVLRRAAIPLLVVLVFAHTCSSFTVPCRARIRRSVVSSRWARANDEQEVSCTRRRVVLATPAAAAAASLVSPQSSLATEDVTPLSLIKQARRQLDAVPALIGKQQWDSVRAILVQPPLADCWTKSNAKLLKVYAQSVDDELAALESREDLVGHLRFLDMAVYNNVFNPIASEGEAGATKELIRSYYEDPINEWKASVAALDELIRLGE